MQDEVLEAEAIEEAPGAERERDADVRALPERRSKGDLDAWRSEVRTAAIAAAGGIAAGAATVAAVSAVRAKSGTRARPRRTLGRGRKEQGILASRSFLIDVHVLGR